MALHSASLQYYHSIYSDIYCSGLLIVFLLEIVIIPFRAVFYVPSFEDLILFWEVNQGAE